MTIRSCSRCGTSAEVDAEDAVPAGWSFETEGKRVMVTCPECVRRNIRAIEGKLPQEWWE